MAEMTDEELEFELQLARDLRNKRRALAAAASAAQPVIQPVEITPFRPVADVEAELAAQAEKVAQEAYARAAEPPTSSAEVAAYLAQRRAEEEARIARQRGQVVTVGRETAPTPASESAIPMFRPTRIREVPVPSETPEPPAAIRSLLPAPTVAAPYRMDATVRLYRDPTTGELRPPTTSEEIIESFAQQPVMSEEQARARGEQIRRAEDTAAALAAAGKPIPADLKSQMAPKVSGVLTQPQGMGRGVTETALGATLRAVPSYLSALASEGYFRGLGYEVDDQGLPVDPTDLAYQVAQIRQKLGIPETATAMDVVTGTAKKLGVELDPRAAAMSPLSAVPLPIPGFATRSQARVPTAVDPEGRRAAAATDEALRNVARNVTAGRSMGDEFLAVPALRQAYIDRYGDERAAFWAGTAGDIIIPAGPGTAARMATKAVKTAAATEAAATVAKGVIRAAEAVPNSAMLGAAADLAAITTKGAASEGRIVRSVARAAIDDLPGLSEEARTAAKAAIKPTDETIQDVVRSVTTAKPEGLRGAEFKKALVQRVPDDLVLATETVAVPRKIASEVKAATAAISAEFTAADDAGKIKILQSKGLNPLAKVLGANPFATLDPQWQRIIMERLASAEAIEAAPRIAREARVPATVRVADEITSLNTQLRATAVPWRDSYLARATAALKPGAGARAEVATVARAKRAIEGASGRAVARVRDAIQADVKAGATVDQAIDKLVSNGIPGARIEPPSPASAWRAIVSEVYGPDRVEFVLNQIDELSRVGALPPKLTSSLPTIEGLRTADKALLRINAVPMGRPDFQKAALKFVFEDVVRSQIAKEGVEFEALARAELPNLPSDVPSGATNPAAWAKFLDDAATDASKIMLRNPDEAITRAVPFLGGGQVTRVYDTLASADEAKLAEGGREFVDMIASIEPAKRLGLGNLLAESTGWTARAMRNSLHGAKYGYYLPNLPYLAYKAAALPVVSLATIGASRTLGGLARTALKAPATFADAVRGAFGVVKTEGRALGAGITTPSGIRYTPAQIENLINQYGIGLSEIDVSRRAALADDLLRDARQTERGATAAAVGAFSPKPWAKSFWMRYAEATELSFRRSVFEGALANGASPAEASDLARRSLFDYQAVPDVVRETIGNILAGAATDYAVMQEFAISAVQNPTVFGRAAKAKLASQRQNDPYGYYGDKGLKSLGIFPVPNPVGESYVYGPEVPIFAPVEDALALVRSADKTITTIIGAYRLAKKLDAAATVEEIGRTGMEGATAAVERYYPQVMAAFEASNGAPSADGKPAKLTLDDNGLFWAALLAADIQERQGNPGLKATVYRLLDPEIVPPPAQFAIQEPGYEDMWAIQPPGGIPHIYAGTYNGEPVFKVYRPSKRGIANIKTIRALAPKVLENAVGPAVALAEAKYAGGVTTAPLFPTGVGPALGMYSGIVTPAPTPEQRRTAMEEGVRVVREPSK